MGLRGPSAKTLGKQLDGKTQTRKRPRVWEKPGLSRAERIIKFVESLRLTSGKYAGKPFRLRGTVTDPHQFTSGRQFAAWLGLTPRANSSGGKERLGRISKMGDQYLRRLLMNGMTSQLRWARLNLEADPWVASLLHRKPPKLVVVAMANKAARVAWTVMTRGEVYRARRPSTQEVGA